VDLMKRSAFMKSVLGQHVYDNFLAAKEAEWQEYIAQVHDWEIDRYLAAY
jgi:glutamine synthetase